MLTHRAVVPSFPLRLGELFYRLELLDLIQLHLLDLLFGSLVVNLELAQLLGKLKLGTQRVL